MANKEIKKDFQGWRRVSLQMEIHVCYNNDSHTIKIIRQKTVIQECAISDEEDDSDGSTLPPPLEPINLDMEIDNNEENKPTQRKAEQNEFDEIDDNNENQYPAKK
ncbi:unnamed protein product [Oikopleura dioica]|uniref:Uncharacterized protein n=1 Tax=Oikopleura dioica TaxID=34765 RepID=E4Y2Z6_OIKDI|nr:unnamed protein product [Oikopleura dioica]